MGRKALPALPARAITRPLGVGSTYTRNLREHRRFNTRLFRSRCRSRAPTIRGAAGHKITPRGLVQVLLEERFHATVLASYA